MPPADEYRQRARELREQANRIRRENAQLIERTRDLIGRPPRIGNTPAVDHDLYERIQITREVSRTIKKLAWETRAKAEESRAESMALLEESLLLGEVVAASPVA